MFDTVPELLQEWNQEAAFTQTIMDALTDASLAQPVSPDGRTLGRVAWHLVTGGVGMLALFGLHVGGVSNPDAVPASAREIAEGWRKVSAGIAEAVKRQWTDQTLTDVHNAFGRDMSNAAYLLLLIKHNIHHRGQMTVLIRQAGLRVPGIYGPAREEWSQFGGEPPAI